MILASLRELIERHVHDGNCVALEGFTHLIPFAAGHEIIRQQRRNLHLVRMTPDLVYDQLIGMGCARKLTFSWGGNPGVGSLHRLRDAVEHAWPGPLELDEHTHAGMAAAYCAGAARLPFGMLRGYIGTTCCRSILGFGRCSARSPASCWQRCPQSTRRHHPARAKGRPAGNVWLMAPSAHSARPGYASRLLVTVEKSSTNCRPR
jgi:acyl CoA:acetate/3-ketoacid CoA transferase alpha subunit